MPETTRGDRYGLALDAIEANLQRIREISDDLPVGLNAALVSLAENCAAQMSVFHAVLQDQRDWQRHEEDM